MVLVGIGTDDTSADSAYLVKKILNLRLFAENDEDGAPMWKKNVMDVDGGVLCGERMRPTGLKVAKGPPEQSPNSR